MRDFSSIEPPLSGARGLQTTKDEIVFARGLPLRARAEKSLARGLQAEKSLARGLPAEKSLARQSEKKRPRYPTLPLTLPRRVRVPVHHVAWERLA